MDTLVTTIVIIKNGEKILLGKKKRGFATGVYIGVGGKREKGEEIDVAMLRETKEEIDVTPTKYNRVGLINFDTYYKGKHENLILNIYLCTEYSGEPKETDEIEPHWFNTDEIPYKDMLEDDILWLKPVLEGKYVAGEVKFSPELVMEYNTIHEVTFEELKEMINNSTF